MSVVSALHRVLVEALIGLAGASSRGPARGKGDGDRGSMLVCKKCAQIVYVGRNKRPDGVERGCDCGHVTTVNWRKTTDQLSGKPCSQCGLTLFDHGLPPRSRTCDGSGGHQPEPVHLRDWRRQR